MTRTLFVGDVHGCSEELERLLQKAQPTRVVLVGDLFTKGPDPAGVWRTIKRWDAEAVLGNHDATVLDTWKPGDRLPRRAFRWLERLPWMIRERRWIAVHAGVNPERPEETRRDEALYLKHWRLRGKRRPWWEVYRGNQLVVHGHHAREGLADRRPRVVGLDTNCVGGGSLSGYLLERDEFVSVRARRAYA